MAFIPSSGGSGGASQHTAGFAGLGQRACYMLWSTGNSDFVWLDQDFGALMPNQVHLQNYAYTTYSDAQRYSSSNFRTSTMLYWNQANNTTSTIGTTSGASYNCFAANTQVGAWWGNFYSDGSYSPVADNGVGYETRLRDRKYYIPSDHSNRAINYMVVSGKMYAKKAGQGYFNADYPGTERYTFVGMNGSFEGMGAYNNTRKEYIQPLAETTGNSGYISVQRWTGVDFDTYPSPKEAFANATLANTFTWQPSSWPSNSSEARYNSKWILKDNGVIIHVVYFPGGSGTRSYVATMPTDNSTVTGSHVNTLSNTTSYGLGSGSNFGQQMVMSRDGKAVCVMSPYYYYWTGINVFLIDLKGTVGGATYTYQHSNSNISTSVLPYQDSGFAIMDLTNGYATTNGGPQWRRWWQRHKDSTGTEGFTNTSSMAGSRPAQYPGYGTTDYPVLCAVTDYSSLKYGDGIRRTTQPFNSSINTGAS